MARGSGTRDGSPVANGERRPQPLPRIEHPGGAARWIKHALDRVLAVLGLAVTSPLFLVIAAVLLARRSPSILTAQARLGDRGPFPLLTFTVPDRPSSFGRFLVATGLVALPQLFNLIRGDMSLVGPRPRLEGDPPPPCRPGLAGAAQNAQARRAISRDEQYAIDAVYAAAWSPWLDIRIVGRCIWDAIVQPR